MVPAGSRCPLGRSIFLPTFQLELRMILVAGATGSLGSQIVTRLRANGEAVRGLVRTTSAPEKVSQLRDSAVDVVVGDLRDPPSLAKACEGVRTVISTVSMIGTAQPGDSFTDTDAAGTISLIDAAKAAGAGHFIFISLDTEQFPPSPLVDGKLAVEAHLRDSGIDYTILQPPPFMEVWLGPMLFGDATSGQVKLYGSGNGRVPYMATADVAEVAVRALSSPLAHNATITFGGPEAITQREAVRAFEKAFGKTLTATEVPEDALKAQWQAAENPFEKTFAGLMLGLAQLDVDPTPLPGEMAFEMTTVWDFAKGLAARASSH